MEGKFLTVNFLNIRCSKFFSKRHAYGPFGFKILPPWLNTHHAMINFLPLQLQVASFMT